MSTISYANIAANGSNGSSNGSSPSITKKEMVNGSNIENLDDKINNIQNKLDDATEPTTVNDKVKTDDVKDSEVSNDLDSQDVKNSSKTDDDETLSQKDESSTSKDKSSNYKPKEKKLAPAPVPQTSAWGSINPSPVSTNNDEIKWPTPPENYKSKPASNQKFIKPITNKWVPLDDAKVILPNSRNQNNSNQNGSNNKKNKNKNKNKTKKTNTTSSSNGSKHEKKDKTNDKVDKSDKLDHKKLDKVEKLDKSDKLDKSVNNTPSPNSKKSDKHIENTDANSNDIDSPKSSTNNSTSNNSETTPTKLNDSIPNSNSNTNEKSDEGKTFQTNGYHQPYPMNYSNRQFRAPSNYRMNRYSLPNNYNNGFMPMPYPSQHHQSLPLNQYYPAPQQFQQQYQQYPYPYYQQQHNQQYFQNSQQFQQPPVMVPPPISPKQDPINALTQQLDYYFSLENLIKDIYLRKTMDSEGWIQLKSILSFKRVQIILNNIKSMNNDKDFNKLIIDSLNNCSNIEVLNNNDNDDLENIKLRVKENYKQWVLDN